MKRLFLVGTGPGAADLLTPRASRALAAASDLVGYAPYLDRLGQVCDGKTRHDLALGQEIARAERALDLAAAGRTTALVSGGDIGVYAMASVVFEQVDRVLRGKGGSAAWLEVELEVIPGISAMQAAASRVGALLGHDFCAISLSDLLTPWETICARVEAAARGDFVVCFYNPVSRRRHWQLDTARDLLLGHRPASTPVVAARNLTREDEAVRILTLAELRGQDMDMSTLVAVGNSESRHIVNNGTSWVYTPRGYASKTS